VAAAGRATPKGRPIRENGPDLEAFYHAKLSPEQTPAELKSVVGKAATFNLLYAFPILLLSHVEGTIGDVARPIILHNRAATCWQPYVKGVTSHNNSLYNSWRLENAWLDK